MIKINEENLRCAYSKLKRYVYYSQTNYLRKKLLVFEESLANDQNVFAKMADDLNDLSSIDESMMKGQFPTCLLYPKKDSFIDIDTDKTRIDSVNVFIDMDIKFFLIDILFCMQLIDIYKASMNELFYGNLICSRLTNQSEEERLKNNLLFDGYAYNYYKWKQAITKNLKNSDIKNTTLLKLDFKKCFYNTQFNFFNFLEKYNINGNDPIVKIEKNIYFAYSHVIGDIITKDKKRGIVQLPIGLPSSFIVQNILFSELDIKISKNNSTIKYSRYVDDLLILVRGNVTKKEFLKKYSEIFSSDNNGDINCGCINSLLINPMYLNDKKIEIRSGSTIKRLKSDVERILMPSMVDFLDEENHDKEESLSKDFEDSLNSKYMKRYIDGFNSNSSNKELLVDYLNKRKNSELLNLNTIWNKIVRILYTDESCNEIVEKIYKTIKSITFQNDENFFKNAKNIEEQLKSTLESELETALSINKKRQFFLYDLDQQDLLKYLTTVIEKNDKNIFYPGGLKFEYIQLFYNWYYSHNDRVLEDKRKLYIENCKILYEKVNGYSLYLEHPIQQASISIISDCDIEYSNNINDSKIIRNYSNVYVLKCPIEKNDGKIKVAIASINIPKNELVVNEFNEKYPSTYDLNDILEIIKKASSLGAKYIIMPEVSVLFRDALRIINYCAQQKISIVAGLSHCLDFSGAVNYTLIYDDRVKFVHLKTKNYYPFEERKLLGQMGYKTLIFDPYYLVIDNGELKYSTMTCYEATNIRDRGFLNN